MKKRIQVFYIHGGMTFKNKKDYLNYLKNRPISIDKKRRWHDESLDKKLGKNFDIIRPFMPLSDNARYDEWKIHFERYFPLLKNNLILIGQSLGAVFLVKYLSEHKFPKKIHSIYLIGTPFDNTLPGEDLVNGFKLKSDLSLIEKNCKKIYFLFAKNDDVVPISHAKKYRNKLKNAKIIIYKHIKGHFKISQFPQLVKLIKSDVK